MIPFLQSVAKGYASFIAKNHNAVAPLDSPFAPEKFCFVFPNKRAGTFFLKYFRSEISHYLPFTISPKVTTISDLTAHLSERIPESRINLLFTLYNAYRDIRKEDLSSADDSIRKSLTFDSFRRWGETVMSDFNEVDMHLTDPESLFKNLSDFRQIHSTFLNEEQRKVLEDYFGYSPAIYEQTKFWVDFSYDFSRIKSESDPASSIPNQEIHNREISDPRRKFVRLWQIMYPLYIRYNELLTQRGTISPGGAYRIAAEHLEKIVVNNDPANLLSLLPYSKIVMIGFNALSGAERKIFDLLKSIPSPLIPEESLTDFIWDATGPIIRNSRNSAGHFVNHNIKHFPAPQWILPFLSQSDAGNSMPEITAISAPSKVSQIKIAAERIDSLYDRIGEQPFNEAKVAMILPDEGLLIPTLYSLPVKISDANLTMGYPLRLTSVTSFITLLRRLQMQPRNSSNQIGFPYEVVTQLLSHPYTQGIIGTERITGFRNHFESHHISVVTENDISRFLGPDAKILLRQIPADTPPVLVCKYLEEVLSLIDQSLNRSRSKDASPLKNNAERITIEAWRKALRIFTDAIDEFKIDMSAFAVMSEAFRIMNGESVPFEGEPLVGLQIMGLLETRALDFDHIFILSLNDKIIPMRSRKRSFLPNIIRHGYGLPPVNYQENIFSYYFYRLISRAKGVTLIYDNRPNGLSGGASRYLMQLRYLHAKGALHEIEYQFIPRQTLPSLISVEKSGKIVSSLLNYLNPEIPKDRKRRVNFSASSIKKYLECPIKFYLSAIERRPDHEDSINGVDDITYGNIIHKAMERLYLPPEYIGKGRWLDPPVVITKDIINAILKDREGIKATVRRLINELHYKLNSDKGEDLDRPLRPDTEIVAHSAITQIENLLLYDRTLTPFNLYGCEISEGLRYQLPDGKIVNVTFAIDRIDDAQCEGNPMTIRIVDYKTGNPHVSADSFNRIFSGDYHTSHLFQLLFYSLMLNEFRKGQNLPSLSIKPVIYPMAKMMKPAEVKKGIPVVTLTDETGMKSRIILEYHDQDGVIDQFRDHLDSKIAEILNPGIPFSASFPEKRCDMCAYLPVCRMMVTRDDN